MIVAGDFNAHLGPTWGPRAHSDPNLQGILLAEVLDRCNLHVASLSKATLGPNYTYRSGSTATIVDYILADIEASSCIDRCQIHEEADLNSSDHLPLSVTLSWHIPTQFAKDSNCTRIDWAKAEASGALQTFQNEIKETLSPYIGQLRGNLEQIDSEIKLVAWLITDATLPHSKPNKACKFRDRTLSQLCAKSKEAWRAWCDSGRPLSEPLCEAKCSLRSQVRQRIKVCAAIEER